MPNRLLTGTLLASALALAGTARALEPKPLNPFDTIDRVQVMVFVGEPIGNAEGKGLFADDLARCEVLTQQLKARIDAALLKHGYRPDRDSEDVISVGIWGHQVPKPGGEVENVFFIELSIVDNNWNPSAAADCARNLEQESRAIGVASEATLEHALILESMRLLRELLPDD